MSGERTEAADEDGRTVKDDPPPVHQEQRQNLTAGDQESASDGQEAVKDQKTGRGRKRSGQPRGKLREAAATAEKITAQFNRIVNRAAAEIAREHPKYIGTSASRAQRDARGRILSQVTEEQVLAAEADWRAGVMPIRAIGRAHGISTSRLCEIAVQRGWPSRTAAANAARELIDDKVMASAVQQFASSTGADPADPDSLLAALNDADERARSNLVLHRYADIVAALLVSQQNLADRAVGAGQNLLSQFDAAIRALQADALSNEEQARSGRLGKDGIEGRLKLLGTATSIYNQLVTAIGRAVTMQRALYGMAAPGATAPQQPAGEAEAAAALTQGSDAPIAAATYEDALTEYRRTGGKVQ